MYSDDIKVGDKVWYVAGEHAQQAKVLSWFGEAHVRIRVLTGPQRNLKIGVPIRLIKPLGDGAASLNWLKAIPYQLGQIADRRRSPRTFADGQIEITTPSGAVFTGIAIDVSTHGIAAIVFEHLAIGDAVQLRFETPSDERLVTRNAIVRARNDHHCGFEFAAAAAKVTAA